jgi:hypothetical protein
MRRPQSNRPTFNTTKLDFNKRYCSAVSHTAFAPLFRFSCVTCRSRIEYYEATLLLQRRVKFTSLPKPFYQIYAPRPPPDPTYLPRSKRAETEGWQSQQGHHRSSVSEAVPVSVAQDTAKRVVWLSSQLFISVPLICRWIPSKRQRAATCDRSSGRQMIRPSSRFASPVCPPRG